MQPIKIHIEAELCRDCQACELACSLIHEGQSNPALARLRVNKDMARYQFNIILCQQCEDPECMAACPSAAIKMDDRGVVVILQEECQRCGACAEACPYHAIFYDRQADRYFKCELCAGVADQPACVEICPVDALTIRLEALPKERTP